MECLLASIFNGFRWVLGANLGGKIDPRSIKNPKGHQKNDREKRASWKRFGGVFGAPKSTGAAARGWTRLHAGAVAETQGPLLGRIGRIPKGLGLLGKNIIRK